MLPDPPQPPAQPQLPEEACPSSACCVETCDCICCIKHVVPVVCGQLTNRILCNTFYVTFLFPLETLHILTLGMVSSGVDWTCWEEGTSRRKWALGQSPAYSR